MGGIVFNQILHLVGCGYTVELSKSDTHDSSRVLRIELRDGEYRHAEFVDMTGQANTEYFISRALSRARDELDYYIKNMEENE